MKMGWEKSTGRNSCDGDLGQTCRKLARKEQGKRIRVRRKSRSGKGPTMRRQGKKAGFFEREYSFNADAGKKKNVEKNE